MGTFGNIKKNKSDITRICVLDFDGTLINTPIPEKGYVQYKEKTGQDWPHKGWWGRVESLDTAIFDMPVMSSVISEYKKESKNPNTLMVMMTGRLPKLSDAVKKILDSHGLKFDIYEFNNGGSTLHSKITSLNKLIEEYSNVKSIALWDDRDEHIPAFNAWGAAQDGIDYHMTHVKSNHHGPQ